MRKRTISSNGNGPVPRAPATLPEDGKIFWRRHAAKLVKSGRLRNDQLASFEAMAMHFALMCAANRVLVEDGPTVKDERGLVRKHPAHQVMRENSQAFRQYADRFGMNPKARDKLSLPPEPLESLDAVLRRQMRQPRMWEDGDEKDE